MDPLAKWVPFELRDWTLRLCHFQCLSFVYDTKRVSWIRCHRLKVVSSGRNKARTSIYNHLLQQALWFRAHFHRWQQAPRNKRELCTSLCDYTHTHAHFSLLVCVKSVINVNFTPTSPAPCGIEIYVRLKLLLLLAHTWLCRWCWNMDVDVKKAQRVKVSAHDIILSLSNHHHHLLHHH